jgi:hypothetical protein
LRGVLIEGKAGDEYYSLIAIIDLIFRRKPPGMRSD